MERWKKTKAIVPMQILNVSIENCAFYCASNLFSAGLKFIIHNRIIIIYDFPTNQK